VSVIVNKASVVLTGPQSAMSMIIVTDGKSPSGASLIGADPNLVVADSASLAAGSGAVLLTMPAAAITAGMAIPFGAVSAGFAIQAMPPGCSVSVSSLPAFGQALALAGPAFGAAGNLHAVLS
jgi:hypothetical protein